MTDLKITLSSFKRLVKSGHESGPVFESSGYLVTSIGGITVYAEKRTKAKIYDGTKKLGYQGELTKAYPYLKAGYISIAMVDSGGVDLNMDEAIEEIETIFESFSEETQAFMLRDLGLRRVET